MIGNDVVDLALAKVESNWQRKGYLNKIFTTKEQILIYSAENPLIMVWILWSRKEAVYKIIRQQNGERGFYPLRIVNIDYELGLVSFEARLFYVKTSIVEDCVHSVALQNQSFNQVNEISTSTQILKKDEIPFIIKNEKHLHISKSHHGRFEKVVRII
jgi:phosphopantetheinyl transferase (holo-ACP synthase)